jgi:hypothetical protein
MAKNTSSIPVKPSAETISVTLTQQSLNMLRQIVANQGWANTIQDIFLGGQLLVQTLPQIDSIAWIKSEEEIIAMPPEEREAYVARDRAWAAKQVPVTVSLLERNAIETAFQHFITTAASAKRLGPSPYLFELINGFQIKDKVVVDEAVKGPDKGPDKA